MASVANISGRARNPSEPNDEKCYVRFINKTTRTVDVIWIDFSARFKKYIVLKNGQFIDVNTYKNHSWMAVDSNTRDAMLLNGVFRYEAQTSQQFINNHLRANRERLPTRLRIVVYITLPLYSLYFRTLMAIRDLVKNEEDVQGLELARHVKEQLKQVVKRKKDNAVLLPLESGEL